MYLSLGLWLGLGIAGCYESHDGCPPAPPGPEDPRMQKLVERFEAHMHERGIPGGIVVVVHGERTFVEPLGVAEDAGCPVTSDTRFALGTMSRTITNIAVLAGLRAKGIDLDSPITEHLDAVPVTRNASHDFGDEDDVTIEHLLSWSAGIPQTNAFNRRFACDESLAEWADGPETRDGRPLELMFEPGALSTLTASEPILLGRLLEELHGEPYAKAVSELVFEPLGMHDAVVGVPSPRRAPVAQPFVITGRGARLEPELSDLGCEASAPHRYVWASADDMAPLLGMLTRSEPGILSGPDLRLIAKSPGPGDPRYATQHMGYGMLSNDYGELGFNATWSSLGPGYKTSMRYFPDEELGVFYAFNQMNPTRLPADDTNYDLHREAVELFFPDRELQPCFCREHRECWVDKHVSCVDPREVRRDRSKWGERYAGEYVSTMDPEEVIHIREDEGELRVRCDDSSWPALVPIGRDVFTVHEGCRKRDTFAFTARREDAGVAEPRWLTIGNGNFGVYVAR